MTVLDTLVKHLSRLPGVGRKSALRIAYHLLSADEAYNAALANDILHLKQRVRPCSICGNYTEADPCDICSDRSRDRTTICVVEQPQDIAVLETTREYRGLYHALTGVISPIDGVGPEDLTIGRLIERLHSGEVREVILATNPTVEGDTTALYLVRLLEQLGVTVTRLALGLPVGGDLEYADRLTIARSLRGRTPLSSG
ncbi:MAG: recombination protein RecR [Spirochaetaceae bacterium]|nr:MAG: recombination protein RecR [Spirochaetaceae bacterium]